MFDVHIILLWQFYQYSLIVSGRKIYQCNHAHAFRAAKIAIIRWIVDASASRVLDAAAAPLQELSSSVFNRASRIASVRGSNIFPVSCPTQYFHGRYFRESVSREFFMPRKLPRGPVILDIITAAATLKVETMRSSSIHAARTLV